MTDTPARSASLSTLAAIPAAELGQGYDSFAGSARSAAVDGVVTKTGARSDVTYRLVRSMTNFAEAINLSAELSAGTEFFDSVSAKVSFYQSLSLTETSVSIVVYAQHAEGSTYDSAALKATAPTDATAEEFFQHHGDSYVASIEKGGEFIAVYTFYTETLSAQADLTSQFSSSEITEGGPVEESFAARIRLAYSSYKSRKALTTHLAGYTGKIVPGEPDQIVEFARTVISEVPNAPVILRYDTLGYENVPGFPSDEWNTIRQNRRLFSGEQSDSLAKNSAKLRALRNQIRSIIDTYDVYGVTVDRASLVDRLAKVDEDIAALRGLVLLIDDHPTVPEMAPPLPTLAWGVPKLNYDQVPLPQWGGRGGADFADVTFEDVLSRTRVSSVQLKGNHVIDQLVTTYVSTGDAARTFEHGRGGGNFGPKLEVAQGDRLLKVSGTAKEFQSAYVITSLSFTFQKGQPLLYPPGTVGGEQFAHTLAADEALIGFSGREGNYLDQLLPVLVNFTPATWSQPLVS